MMVGEHDWFLDMGEKWRELFGQPTYSFDHKGVHFVVLDERQREGLLDGARHDARSSACGTVAGLDNGIQSRFEVGAEQREWLKNDLANVASSTPVIVFSHSPLYKYYQQLELLDRGRRRGAGDPEAVRPRDRDPRPHPPDAHQPHRQHRLPRHAVDRLAVAVRARGAAEAHRADEPSGSVRPERRLRRRQRAGLAPTVSSTRSTTSGTATPSK